MLGMAIRDGGLALSDVCALARAADDSGFDSIWVPEYSSRDAILVSSLIGSATKRAKVGTGVVSVYARTPVGLALSCAGAAEVSGGRFVLGLGTGHRSSAESWFDATWRRPRVRMRETIQVLRRIFAGERVTHNGEVRMQAFHLGHVPPPIPIYVGALTPASLRLAGELADGVILNWMPPAGMGRCTLLAREAAADAGREIHTVGYVPVAVAQTREDEAAARAVMREQTYAFASLPSYAASMRHSGLGPLLDRMAAGDEAPLDGLVEAMCLCGDAKRVRSGVEAYAAAGLDTVAIQPVGFGEEPTMSVLQTLRALAPS